MPEAYLTVSEDAEILSPRAVRDPFNCDVMYTLIERKDLELYQSLGGTNGVSESLHVDLGHGLSPLQVEDSRQKYGRNELPEAEHVTYWQLVCEALKDLMMRLLIVAAVISIVFGMTLPNPQTGVVDRTTGWIEGTAILISVAIVVNVTAINDYQKAKKFEEMCLEQSKRDVEVLRDGEKMAVDISDLVVGDLLFVAAGQSMPADGLFVQGQDLKADESVVTGESDVMKKRPETDPFFISGTNLLEGEGLVLLINVGERSFAGKLSMAARGTTAETPLQVKLGWLADMIGKLGLAAAILTFLVLSVKDVVKIVKGETKFNISSYLNFLLVGITLIVVAIPEGLPLAVTISLAYSMKQMMREQCLVRVLAACETMGGANTICSDKTGTLTTNAMTVVQGWIAGDNFVLHGHGVIGGTNAAVTEVAAPAHLRCPPDALALLGTAVAQNSTGEERTVEGREVWVGGNKTEHGLLSFVKWLGQDYRALRTSVASDHRKTFPFSSARKRTTTLVRDSALQWRAFVTGAAELVLEDCDAALTPGGPTPLEESGHLELLGTIEQMATQGNRILAVAYCDVQAQPQFPEEEPPLQYTLIALLGIQDPIRPEVPDAIAKCNQAGISVRMVTGDNRHTAVAIAQKCGLLGGAEEGQVMEGREFRRLVAHDLHRLKRLLPRLRVLARSSPTDKLVLVALLMEEGDIVAVTGDGTNDAPALKLADVGFAMRSGTEVATGAAEMVLMDDNFATVVRAAVWGRNVNENIRKFLQFQLTVNVSGVLLTLIGSALSRTNEEPLRPVQLLWLNLIMDTLAALALATETPAPDTLTRPGSSPIGRGAPLISRRMWVFITVHAVWQLSIVLTLLYLGPWVFNVGPCAPEDIAGYDVDGRCVDGQVSQTALFNVYIWLQLFNEFNARKLFGELNPFEGLRRSKVFLVIFLVCAAFQFCAVQFFGRFMGTVPLDVKQWFICIGFGATEWIVGMAISFIPVPSWSPKSTDENKKGLSELKRASIKEAIANAGLAPTLSSDRDGVPRGPRERWAYAISGVMTSQRVVKAIVESKDSGRGLYGAVIRRRRDSCHLAFRNHHPAAQGTGIRVV